MANLLTSPSDLQEFISKLPNRTGERPKTKGPAPHTQITDFPEGDKYASKLLQHVKSFPGVEVGSSKIGDAPERAFFIPNEKARGFGVNFIIDNEVSLLISLSYLFSLLTFTVTKVKALTWHFRVILEKL